MLNIFLNYCKVILMLFQDRCGVCPISPLLLKLYFVLYLCFLSNKQRNFMQWYNVVFKSQLAVYLVNIAVKRQKVESCR